MTSQTVDAIHPFRLALVSDMLEEKWFSMDLISDMLFHELSTSFSQRCSVRQIRPVMKRLLSDTYLGADSRRARLADRLLNRHFVYPRFLRAQTGDFDLFHVVDHSYAHLASPLPAARVVVTCHDLDAFQSLLEPSSGMRAQGLRLLMRKALQAMRRAAHVIFISHAVRNRALQLGVVSTSHSSVIPMGVHPACSLNPNVVADRRAEELLPALNPGPVLLHVGSTAKRKRLDVVLGVTAEVAKAYPGTILLRVGGAFEQEHRTIARRLNITGRVFELPHLERDVLASVYRRADIVLQTSESEGFGLPVVEAMACGCPVVASDIEVLREVGGAAAEYCPVGDIECWSKTVVALLRDGRARKADKTEHRKTLARHAGQFSWLETTRKVVGVYENVLGRTK